MITQLKIRNYALIEELEIGFDPGFTTITGETGAGKSILMGALSLILGQRAESNVLLQKDTKCVVEGEFRIARMLKVFFEENDLDYESLSLLRREILPSGKSRAFINDTPVTLNVLKDLGDQLVDIHSQHQSLRLGDYQYQMEVLDYICENGTLLTDYRAIYRSFQEKKIALKKAEEEIGKIKGELDFFQYQLDELMKADLKAGELAVLEAELQEQEHAEEIKMSLLQSDESISGEGKVLSLLSEALALLRKSAKVHAKSAEYVERLDAVLIELKDVSIEMKGLGELIENDASILNALKNRVDLLYSLIQKHRVKDVESLIGIRDELNKKVEAITFSDENLNKMKKELDLLNEKLREAGAKLHERRVEKAPFIESSIIEQLHLLGIANAAFIVRVDSLEEPDSSGMDSVRFLFSANKQSPPEEISKVASGGEISRVMLSIKSLLSDYKGLPTLIFDEIDTGVSGEIADKMGFIMKRMAGSRQVIAITHLPQVAAQGHTHILVFKEDESDATVTRLRKLNDEERVVEIAKLLSGEEVTGAALSNAKELLRN